LCVADGAFFINNGHQNHWLEIDLVGDDCNSFGVGARVTVTMRQLQQMREVCTASGFNSQNSLTLEYGLGPYGVVDTIEIRWPCGKIDRRTRVAADQILTIEESTVNTTEDEDEVMPTVFFLAQNHPNPFRKETLIRYDVPNRGLGRRPRVRLKIYDSAGRLVKTLADADQSPGYYGVKWNCTDESGGKVGAGIYFCTMESAEFTSTRKMTVLR
jgi:hypothetical protein